MSTEIEVAGSAPVPTQLERELHVEHELLVSSVKLSLVAIPICVASAWLVATIVQFLLIAVALRGIDFRPSFSLDWHDKRVRQVMILFVPVTVPTKNVGV